ncbi:MAG: glycosyltransferase family 10 [Saprospiraceae bacterium]|nr:glycosyltransferase family 10 [Saprospiraceae bacterium]
MVDKKEILVRVYCGWDGATTLLRQTPNLDGVWENVRFVIDDQVDQPLEEADYFLVFNWPLEDLTVHCPKGNRWLVSGEPPMHYNKFAIPVYKEFDKIFTQHRKSFIKHHIKKDPTAPWFVKKNYKELLSLPNNAEHKLNAVSCVTSNLTWKPGHADRLAMLEELKKMNFPIETYGRGIRPMPNDDKFEILYPYRYSIAIENSYYDHYWTEKLADCFLSWTMPIYAGAPNVVDYFPKEAIIFIDPKKPKEALEIIKEALETNAWEKNLEAIEESRNLILNKYQFFPYFVDQIRKHEAAGLSGKEKVEFKLNKVLTPWHKDYKPSLYRKIEYHIRKMLDIKPY